MLKQLVASVFVTGLMTTAVAGSPTTGGTDTETIKATLATRFPRIQVVDVQQAPMPGLYEVFTGNAIYYTDKSGDYLFRGTVIDARTQEDLTSTRVDNRNHIDFNSLPFDRFSSMTPSPETLRSEKPERRGAKSRRPQDWRTWTASSPRFRKGMKRKWASAD